MGMDKTYCEFFASSGNAQAQYSPWWNQESSAVKTQNQYHMRL
jgi:hypothetical protein